jgi:hypothetical protein
LKYLSNSDGAVHRDIEGDWFSENVLIFFLLALQLMWEKTSFPSDIDLAQMTDLTAADWLHSAANKI